MDNVISSNPMPTFQESNTIESKAVAFDAIQTIPGSDPALIKEFLAHLEKNQFSPIARMNGFPVYRLDDFQTNTICYMSNERVPESFDEFTVVEFSVFGSYLVFGDSPHASVNQNARYLVSQEIINIAADYLRNVSFTPAELRLVAQILSGLQLKTAANEDNVSLETKRSHLKTIMGKLQVSRQQEVIRLLLPELMRLTDPRSWDKEGQLTFNQYARDFLPKKVRCQRISDPQGKTVRVIDYGPVRGKPVLILHALIFPDITSEDVDFANEHNLRIIWPLRPGILETVPTPKAVELYAKETLQGIELAWENMCGEPVPLIAMVSSAWHAVSFAKTNPDKVTNITFAATCFSAGKYENNLVYFGSSVIELCSRNVWLMTKTVDFIRENVTDIERFKTTIYRIHKNSAPDVQVLDREFTKPNGGARIMMALLESSESVKHDYFSQVNFRWSSVSDLKIPVRFVHGTLDSIHKIKDVKKLISTIGEIPLETFETTGHMMQYEHFHHLLTKSLELSSKDEIHS